MTVPELDVAVVGDGPAGLALARACHERGLVVAVVGDDRPWTATYATWVDDVPDLPARCFAAVSPSVVVHGRRRHEVPLAYATFDGDALREHLGTGLRRRPGRAVRAQHFGWGTRVVTDSGDVDARVVVDATGRASAWHSGGTGPPVAWQTAHGVVVDQPPGRFDRDVPTFMDLRPTSGGGPPTFCYVVPLADGWLVEETALAARPAIGAEALRRRLDERLGGALGARRVETVTIPLGGRLPDRRQPIVAFGAAAGLTHPATGYSVAAALRVAPRVADALVAACRRQPGVTPDPRPVHDAVWPRSARRTRRLHDHGLEVLLRLGPNELAEFFDAFFDLPVAVWAPYLRVDAPPRDVSRAMVAVLRRLPPPVRRRVLTTWPRRARPGAP